MNERERAVLERLATANAPLDVNALARQTRADPSAVQSTLASLEGQKLARVERDEQTTLELTDEGRAYAANGTPERRLANALKNGALAFDNAVQRAGLSPAEAQIALAWARKNAWVAFEKKDGATVLALRHADPTPVEQALAALADGKPAPAQTLPLLVQRKLATERAVKTARASITPAGRKALEHAAREVSQLTPDLLKTGAWKDASFKAYDVRTLAAPFAGGKRHAYKEFLSDIRRSLEALGFEEMNGPLVETEFWNLDALFMAQDHPAREIHEIFHLDAPRDGTLPDAALVERVRRVHEEGTRASAGWRYQWSAAIAKRLVMRSHTTAVSARTLAAGVKPPARHYAIGTVFRPDEIDWKHMIEFNQCEGIVVDEGMSFRELAGYLKTFATQIFGAARAKIVPSYYPFTEPSADLVVDVPGKGWVEAGGAGLFRPEMLEALGVDVPVLAWGLGIDRLAQFRLGTTDIRDLYTPDVQKLAELRS